MVVRRAVVKDALREIAGTRSRFFSLFILSALAAGFLAGLKTTAPSMRKTGDLYFDESGMTDVRIVSTLGLTGEDLEAVSRLEGVKLADGGYTADAYLKLPDNDLVVKLHSVSARGVDRPAVTEGRLPEAADECAVDPVLLKKTNLTVGDAITLDTGGGMYKDALHGTRFTIVGVARSPEYISFGRGSSTLGSGSASAYILLPESAFAMETYTDLYLLVSGAKERFCFSDAYQELIDPVVSAAETLGETRAPLRRQKLESEAESKLSDAKTKLADAQREADQGLADARAKLDQAEQQLRQTRKELDSGAAELASAKRELNAALATGRQKINTGRAEIEKQAAELARSAAELAAKKEEAEQSFAEQSAQLDQSQKQVDAGRSQLESGNTQLAALESQIAALEGIPGAEQQLAALRAQQAQLSAQLAETENQLSQSQRQIDAGRGALASARQQLADSEARLAAGQRQLEQARTQLDVSQAELEEQQEKGEAQIAASEKELAAGERRYRDGIREKNEGEAEYADQKQTADTRLADARAEIADAEQQIADIPQGKWYVLDRRSNEGYVSYQQDADRMAAVSGMFPVIFFIVAALVCLTTMTRMVDEQRTEIGVLKALGYNRRDIARKYVGYALWASLGGAAAGLIAGCALLPRMIFNAYAIIYAMPAMKLQLDGVVCFWSVFAAAACTTGAAIWASLASLTASPAGLMRPRAPEPGKRVLLERMPLIWSRLNFTGKVTVRNLFRYKKRFWMTVLGVGGCMALLITGFGLHDSIFGMMDKQYNELYHFQLRAVLDKDVSDQELTALEQAVKGNHLVAADLPCRQSSVTFSAGERTVDGGMIVPGEGTDLSAFVTLRTPGDRTPLALPASGALIDQKLAELLGVSVGDRFVIEENGVQVQAVVGGIAENYIMHFAYMTPACYQSLFGRPAGLDSLLVRCADDSDETAQTAAHALMSAAHVKSVSLLSETRNIYSKSMDSINYVILVVILAAAALAFVVLFNLTNINITERLRELATLKVLGFYDRELSAYVYRENIVLTLIGVILGVFMGYFLHHWLIRTVEIDALMFVRSAKPASYVYAALLTGIFAAAVNFAAHWRLKKISMVESLKSVD